MFKMKCAVSSLLRQYAVVVIVNLSVFTTGISLAWPSPILVKLNDPDRTPLSRPITDDEGSWIVSVGFLCAALTNFFFGMLLDAIGRKYCILLLFIPKLSMGLLFIFATEVWMLILGRAVMSAVDCYVLVVVPVYASELASKKHRGALGTLLQVFASLGELVTLSIGPFVSYKTFNTIFTCLMILTLVPVLLFLPDSPSFLYLKGRKEEALKTLTYLRGNAITATKEIEEYKLLNADRNKKIDITSFFRDRVFIKSLALATMLSMGTQIIGFNAVTFYLQTIFISTNTSLRSEIASMIIGVIQVISSVLTHAVISSRFNRKTILYVSLGAMCIGMMGLGVFFKISEPEDYVVSGFMNYLPLICLTVVISSYISGIGSMVWLIIGELFNDTGRALGVSIALSGTVSLIFLTSKYFPFVATSLGPATTYWIFSAMILLLITLIAIFLPETKGMSFNEIQKSLGKENEAEEENKESI